MAKILFGWELGTGHGHVARLLAVARGLAAAGHQPIFAVRNMVEPAALFDGCSFPVIQAPVWQGDTRVERASFSAAALSDIFYTQGFGDPDDLSLRYASDTGNMEFRSQAAPDNSNSHSLSPFKGPIPATEPNSSERGLL